MDWIAFDPEHSIMFARGPYGYGTVYTFVTTRELNLVYFDGASANKVPGVVDSQDLLFWGNISDPDYTRDIERIAAACEWGKEYGIDGYLRMEFNLCVSYYFVTTLLISAPSTQVRSCTAIFRKACKSSMNFL